MGEVTVKAFIDKHHPRTDDVRCVSIRVTHLRVKRYYKTDIKLKPSDFEKIINAKRRTEKQNEIYEGILNYEKKARDIRDALKIFTFSQFEESWHKNRNATKYVFDAFEDYIKELIEENRLGTASSYKCAQASLNNFSSELKFADVNRKILNKYEKWMIEKGNNKTTVGIYLRSLRTLFNRTNIDKSLYPFGEGKKLYSIPTGRNIKKALTLEEIGRIFNYDAPPNSSLEMARDYWIFIYLSNGLNVKDLCNLKYKNIKGDILKYEREKTKLSKRESTEITVSLKPKSKEIITKWGQNSLNPEAHIFPHLSKKMTPEDERKIVQQLTKTINKYMKRIAKELCIDKNVTTYYARHSFATVLRNSGAHPEFIREALGHSSLKTTQNYFAGFEDEAIHSTTDALTNFGNN